MKFKKLMSEPQLAAWVGVNRLTIQRNRLKGKPAFPYLRIFRRVRYYMPDVIEHLEKYRVQVAGDLAAGAEHER